MASGRRLSEAERRELRLRARREVGRVSERVHMVLLADRGFGVAQIAAIYECSEATVRQWLARFESGGLEARRDLPRSGRPRKADAAARAAIRQAVERPPAEAGYRSIGTTTRMPTYSISRWARLGKRSASTSVTGSYCATTKPRKRWLG